MNFYVLIDDNGNNGFYIEGIHSSIPSGAISISKENYDKFFADNGKYRFIKSTSNNGTTTAILEEIIPTTEEKLATAITNLNSIAISEIKIQENRYTAAMTSSSYTDAELTEILTEVKTEKLAIVKKLISDQEALING